MSDKYEDLFGLTSFGGGRKKRKSRKSRRSKGTPNPPNPNPVKPAQPSTPLDRWQSDNAKGFTNSTPGGGGGGGAPLRLDNDPMNDPFIVN